MAKRRGVSRKFKGVWIPRKLWFARDLTPVERCLLAEIHSLSDRDEGCDRTDGEFADFFQISKRSVGRGLAKLKNLELINVIVDKQGGNKRIIFMVEGAMDNLAIGGTDKMAGGVRTKWQKPIDKLAVHNIEDNTVSNTGGGEQNAPSPQDPADQKQKKTPETKADRAWEWAREKLEDELHFPDKFLEFFGAEVMGRWNKFEVTVAVVKDWHRQLYLKFDTEMVAEILSDYSARHKGWQPKLAEVVTLVTARDRAEKAASARQKEDQAKKNEVVVQAGVCWKTRVMNMTEAQARAKYREGNPFERSLIKSWRPELFRNQEAEG